MTHDELIKRAVKWLKNTKRYTVILVELSCWTGTSEEPDVLGFKGTESLLIECKTSRNDFFQDQKKFARRHEQYSLGQKRYYMTPKGLLKEGDLPEGWGWLEIRGKIVRVLRESNTFEARRSAEIGILVSALRRIGEGPYRKCAVVKRPGL